MLNFLILSDSVSGKDFTNVRVNPGVGGTEYLTVMLAVLIAEKFADLNLTIYTKYHFNYDTSLQNLNVQVIDTVDAQIIANKENQKWLLTVNVAWELHCLNLIESFENVILWSHHPSDWRAAFLRKNALMVISTGVYQFCSNWLVHTHNLLLPNIFLRNHRDSEKHLERTDKQFNVMYLGALVPAKGFHLLLREWGEICRRIPHAKLHVIGGSNLYGRTSGMTSDFPCDVKYEKTLKSIIATKMIDMDSIKFYGTLGDERFKIYRQMDAAVINPSGRSESFSFNLHECLDYGVPVIASHDYGLNDVMCGLPDQSVKKDNGIMKILLRLHSDLDFRKRCKENQFKYIESLEIRNLKALLAWRSLILGDSTETFHFELNLIRLKGYLRAIMVFPKALVFSLKYSISKKVKGA